MICLIYFSSCLAERLGVCDIIYLKYIMSVSFTFTPTYIFLSNGSSLSGWTNSGITISSGFGNPAPSFAGTGSSQYAYINPASLSSLVGYIILVDMYATGATPLIDFFFGCNSIGAGQMFRLEARGGTNGGFTTTTTWTSWGTPLSGTYALSANTWYTIKIVITSTATNGMSWYFNNVLGGTGTFVDSGGYIGLQADGGSGGYWDNIKIYKINYVPIPASIGYTTIPLVSAIPKPFNTVSSNTLTVSSYTVNTFQNGTYIASASSVSEGKQAWNMLYGAVSNSISTADYWHCASSGWDGYTQSPYDANGSYVGGGTGFFQSTVVQVAGTIAGEWVQIQLPYKLKLSTYSLYPRQNIGWFSRYPTILYVVGSNNGTTWYQVDYRTLSSTPATNLGAITYTIIPNTGYMYFRLITNAVNAGNPVIHYGDWTLTGYASGNDSSIPASIGYILVTAITFSGTVPANESGSVSGYDLYVFNQTSTSYSIPYSCARATQIYAMVVAGGGSGGATQAGGGGGGGVVMTPINIPVGTDTMTINVGAGGIGSTVNVIGNNGGNSTITFSSNTVANITATGGGRGGTYNGANNLNGASGGSSGGQPGSFGAAGVATSNTLGNYPLNVFYGNQGASNNYSWAGSGGGGAGAASNSTYPTNNQDGGPGGIGIKPISPGINSYAPYNNYYFGSGGAGSGGGNGQQGSVGAGAGSYTGGGVSTVSGTGGTGTTSGQSASVNTGAGGGGGASYSGPGTGGSGGSGIVIIAISNNNSTN